MVEIIETVVFFIIPPPWIQILTLVNVLLWLLLLVLSRD
jgi:hypothetical protein